MDAADKLAQLRTLGFEDALPLAVSFEQVRLERDAVKVIGTRPALGTLVSVTVVASSPAQGETAIERAFAELDRLAAILSRYESTSALSALNEAGYLTGPPPELLRVLERALYYHALSRGAFDVTVKPVLDLLAARLPANPPTAGELKDAAALVGTEHVAVRRKAIRLERSGMGLTLDGIAKGHIVDRMADVLACHGMLRFLIDAGGDIRARGIKEPDRPWTVAVRGRSPGAFADVIGLRDGAVATSGGYERFYDPQRRFHHIVNPASGGSPDLAWSVSVVAPTALAADALATAVFVLGPDDGLRLIERLPDCAGFVVPAGGADRRSRRWSRFSIWQEEPIV
ncbi:MAG: FAD:protein FMN transferase [Gemmatimonadetes bacterium]|nr:FAD:protein FMN transferase [Gemmatimonadota bacterium]